MKHEEDWLRHVADWIDKYIPGILYNIYTSCRSEGLLLYKNTNSQPACGPTVNNPKLVLLLALVIILRSKLSS